MVSLPPKAASVGISNVKVKRVKRKGDGTKVNGKSGWGKGENPGSREPKDQRDEEEIGPASDPASETEDILLSENTHIEATQDFPQSPVEKYIVKRK